MGEPTARAHGALEAWAAEELRRLSDIEVRWSLAGDPVSDELVELEAVDVEQAWSVAEGWWSSVVAS